MARPPSDAMNASDSELSGRQNGRRQARTSQIAKAIVSAATLMIRSVTEYRPMNPPPPSAVR